MSQSFVLVIRRGALAVGAALVIAVIGAGAAQAAIGPYVSLGDSYTAAPLVPNPTGNPILCGRSTNNYPSDVSRALSPSSFSDASCSSATTVDMTQSQSLEGGLQTAPPQFNALKSNDALVTVGIGGNDAGLLSVVEECAKLDIIRPFGTACKSHYTSGGSDPNVAAVNATGPKVAAVIQSIHARAPQAEVMVVGYPDGLPTNGSDCWPLVPISAGDITYVNSLETSLNTVLRNTANANGAKYVDTFTSSIGHDACKSSGTAWVNGIVPTSAAFPLHPNQTGETNMANQVLKDR
ncbi:MAG TPA: SGNH/GDSL hydrolase family protein [Solirubrobacteraceae bacterium]|nr:SGNH/GDSL hydrolase family protein [Solirubrobacteraceae bacterium]